MKLLIITQKVDHRDPILGFFHRWIAAFAAQVAHVTVVTQYAGDSALSANVHVVSLGKERGLPPWRQVLSFWRAVWTLRGEYDRVFVHMTPIWVILGWPLWMLLRKPVYLWYEIRRGSIRLSLALLCVRKVFSATSHGLPHPSSKQEVLGHGIDIDTFVPGRAAREEGLIVAAGRITRSKQYDVILQAFAALPSTYRLLIAGGTITARDQSELECLQALMQRLHIAQRVEIAWVAPEQMPSLLCRARLLLHACIGGLDKIVLEAMACGCPVVTCSRAATGVLSEMCLAVPGMMGDQAKCVLALSSSERDQLSAELRRRVVEQHNLSRLIERLVLGMH